MKRRVKETGLTCSIAAIDPVLTRSHWVARLDHREWSDEVGDRVLFNYEPNPDDESSPRNGESIKENCKRYGRCPVQHLSVRWRTCREKGCFLSSPLNLPTSVKCCCFCNNYMCEVDLESCRSCDVLLFLVQANKLKKIDYRA